MTTKRFTLALAREAFNYDPVSGVVSWNPDRPRCHFPTDKGHRIWLGRDAGNPAGSLTKDGYLSANFTYPDGQRTALMIHRIAWMLGNNIEIPAKMQIDHHNGDRLDNRLVNLRLVGPALNSRNAARTSKPSSGYSGIHETSTGYKVRLTLEPGARPTVIGHFRTLEEAILARRKAALPLGYTDRHLGLEGMREAA